MEMKKLLISLLALAALSGAAYASDYGNSNGDNGTYIRKSTDSSALVIVKKGKKLTTFERMNLISEDNGDRRNDHGGQK
jgi:hypothetical protein